MTFLDRAGLIIRLALRDLRGGIGGFGVLIACIAIGVGAIVTVSSLARGLTEGLAREGRTILGGDLAFSIVQRPATEEELRFISGLGPVMPYVFLRAMARTDSGAATLVEMKAVGPQYPGHGVFEARPKADLADLLAAKNGVYGMVADPVMAGRLDLKIGDTLTLGGKTFQYRAEIANEPDKVASGVGFGPRVIVSREGLDTSGLLQPGVLMRYSYRVTLAEGANDAKALDQIIASAKARFPEAGWDIRSRLNAAPQLTRNLERFTQFLTLVGLTALAVGGVGVANAAAAFVERKRLGVAALKSMGADGGLVFSVMLLQVLLLGLIGTLIGLALGALAPYGVKAGFGTLLPFPLATALYGRELLTGAFYGLLTVATFSIWSLGRAHDVPVSALFRDLVADRQPWPRRRYVIMVGLSLFALGATAILFAWDRLIAMIYVGAAAGAFILLRMVASLIMALARRAPKPARTEFRLAVVNLYKPGALTQSIMLSLGLGLTLLVALGVIDANLRRQLAQTLPETAPSFFFLDVPNGETSPFVALLAKSAPGAKVDTVPMMRGRIVSLKGVRAEAVKANERVAWALEGDRGVTFSATVPTGSSLVEGTWWAADYSGPPLVSFEADVARGLGLGVGDKVTVNVLGRNLDVTIANLRKVEWQSLGINFVMVFSPNTFAGAPYANLATLTLPKGTGLGPELAVMKSTAAAFPSVVSIRVKEALEQINAIVSQLALAIRTASGIAILSSIIVLGGALATGREMRAREAVILKTLGATRSRLLLAMVAEYALLGLTASVFGLLAGTVAGYSIVVMVMKLPFSMPWLGMLGIVFTSVCVSVVLGMAGTWRILGQKPASYLRNA